MTTGIGSFRRVATHERRPTPVTTRVSPSERIRAEIDDLFASEGDLADVLEQVARLGARMLLQTALEAEITEHLGRNRYERRARAREARTGQRHGYGKLTIKTTAGPLTLERPKLRGTTEAFASRLLGAGVTKTNALESLVIAGFVRGLSVRDVEATLAEALGPEATVSRSTVARICEAIKDEFDAFKTRDLSEIELEYLFIDGSHFRMHPGTEAEPVLVAWGIDVTGKPHLLHLEPGATESTDAWAGFLRGMLKRGLRPPLLVISDGGAGLIAAVEIVLSASLRQRCLIHYGERRVMCTSGADALVTGGPRAAREHIITGFEGRRAARLWVGSGLARSRSAWYGRGLALSASGRRARTSGLSRSPRDRATGQSPRCPPRRAGAASPRCAGARGARPSWSQATGSAAPRSWRAWRPAGSRRSG